MTALLSVSSLTPASSSTLPRSDADIALIKRMVELPASSAAAPSAEETWLNSAASRCIQLRESTTINGKTLDPRAHGNIWQFERDQWKITTGLSGHPGSYTRAVQNHAAYMLYLQRSWQPWPNTSRACHLR